MLHDVEARDTDDHPPDRSWLMAGLLVGLVVAVVAAAALLRGGSEAERSDVLGQGGEGPPLATGGAELFRSPDGLRARIDVPTPVPGSYEYPTADMVRDESVIHPEVVPGSGTEPEVFTLWMFVFNYPDQCDDECDGNDIGPDTSALGGVFQVDGRIADRERLVMAGRVRLGQVAANGVALENPLDAEVHYAIAPHGRAAGGAGTWVQLNNAIGAIPWWWGAAFLP